MSLSAERGNRRRAALLLLAGMLPLALAWPHRADETAKTRERLEREIEERQEALDRLEHDPAPTVVEVEQTVPEVTRAAAGQDEVVIGGSRVVRSGVHAPGMVLVGGTYQVEEGAVVESDVTVIGGMAQVSGKIEGTLVVVGGSIALGDGAEVEGDLVSIGGPIREHGHAEVGGQKVQIAFGDIAGLGSGLSAGPGSWAHPHGVDIFGFSIFELIYRFFRFGLLLVVVFAVVLLAPGRVASVAAMARAQPWRSGLIGLVAEVAFLPILLLATVVLLVSVIGIPLVLIVPPLLVIALIFFFVVGYTGVAMAAGGIFERRFDRRYSIYGLVLLGMLLIEGWSVAGEILFLLPGPIKFMAFLALAFGFFVQYVAWTIGLGAALGDQAERRRRARAALAPAALEPPGR